MGRESTLGLLHDILLVFFTALGVVLGGCVVGALSSIASMGSPFHTMVVLAKSLKLWAILAAIGGSFTTVQAIDTSVWNGEFRTILYQFTIVLSGFFGASAGYWIVVQMVGGE